MATAIEPERAGKRSIARAPQRRFVWAIALAGIAAGGCSVALALTSDHLAEPGERGSGLRGLADRIEALGGRLRVWTPAGGGTRVRAEIPCA
jgi:hypothetical protein